MCTPSSQNLLPKTAPIFQSKLFNTRSESFPPTPGRPELVAVEAASGSRKKPGFTCPPRGASGVYSNRPGGQRKFRMRRGFFVSFALLILSAPLAAQNRGTISGFVRDNSGAVVPGANITLTHEGTGAVRNTTSDAAGSYQILALVSGNYTIEAEVPGFKKYRNAGVVLRVDENVRADMALEIGQVTESVEVSAQATLVDTRSSQTSATIDDRRLVNLALRNRNVFALAAGLPGVLGVSAPDNSDLGDARAGPVMNVNGGRRNMNYIRFNGT